MKKYCLNCGYGSEYSGMPPEKCEKCKTSFATAASTVIHTSKEVYDNGIPARGDDEDLEIEDSEFESFVEEPEPLSENEMAGIFLSDAHQGINLRDLVQKNKKIAQPKTKTRKKNK